MLLHTYADAGGSVSSAVLRWVCVYVEGVIVVTTASSA